ncbi:antitoxin VbhA family protein [Hymenobacter sp. DH14]|uniref:Antitoxin VbhA family protein n=1 Tax=Hymenobacter cyanobacteriorum TaxID=2926463 RepID=A0A9X2AHF9_9BACT|nr:antitoxin VbhA family protein [Hymenobacter cyanobacteriorum]MCI1189817.1 antitoxin VbhA family protein [Hymenobacter cyanobacteriorum]
MNYSLLFEAPEHRQHAVNFALALSERTTLEPGPYERQLLARFVAGELLLSEVEALLEKEALAPRPSQNKLDC